VFPVIYELKCCYLEEIQSLKTEVFPEHHMNLLFYVCYIAGHSSRGVLGMNCFRSLGRWDRGFESQPQHGRLVCNGLFCVSVVLCVGSGLATG
jgi:hypothetical protein